MPGYGTGAYGIGPYGVAGTTYNVWIGGKAVFVIAGTLTVSNSVGRKSQASFQVKTDIYAFFVQYQKVVVYDITNTPVFTGYISSPQARKPGFQPVLVWTINCVGPEYIAKKRVVQAAYSNMTCGAIVRDIYTNILAAEGVVMGTIYDGPTISNSLIIPFTIDGNQLLSQANFFCKVADALDQLVTAASSAGVPYYWSIDQNLVLDFAPYGTITGPAIDDTKIDEQGNPPTITFANPSYRNGQYITGGVDQTATQTESRKGDSNTTSWPMSFDLASAPTINVNSSAKTVGIKGIDSGKDFYWQQGSPDIVQDSGGIKLTSSDTLNVTYIGQFPSTALIYNAAQIAYQAAVDGTSGKIEEIQTDKALTTASNALAEGSNLLTRFAQQGAQLTFTMLVSSVSSPGFAPGQLCAVNMSYFNLISTSMLIESVVITDSIDAFNIWYQITAIIGPYDTSWVDFFGKLVGNLAPANASSIGQSTSVSTLVDLTATMTPTTANLNISVYACPIIGNSTIISDSLIVC